MTYERIFPTDRHGNPLGPSREEIVRCRDCKHFEPTAKNGICHRSEFLPMWAELNGFCAWGARADS